MKGHQSHRGRLKRARRTMALASAIAMAAGFFAVGPQSVFAASPTITTTALPTSGALGTTLKDSADLEGASSFDGNGSITFNLYAPGDTTCSGSPVDSEVINGIVANGTYTTPNGVVADAAGTYNWVASFSGDVYAPVATVCTDEPVSVAKASPTISTQLNANPITVGGSDYDTAALAGFAPGGSGGTVTYTAYSDNGCTTGAQSAGTVTIDESTGVATQSNSVSFTAAGTVSWEAVFNGDTNDNTATSACEPLVISNASPTIVTILNASAITVGGTDYDTSALSNFASGGSGGTVTYTVYTDNVCTTAVQSGGTVTIDESTGA
ncbi:MAG TPA: hypothetical protein VND88_11705, partial [Candidatus Acidoferrales bacterium]|nr:hypothetical protein [Candidatus Acidoferrales bacterium]